MNEPTVSQTASDLEQRIEVIEALGDEELGSFTRWDWWVCIVAAVVIPAILLWRFAE